jgi:predicted ATP-grasp superfamily ATP-dependent carboligase
VKIAVLEFICSGGATADMADLQEHGASAYSELYREGFAMLHAVSCDLMHCGHSVVLCLDRFAADQFATHQLATHQLAANGILGAMEVVRLQPHKPWRESWIEIATRCELTIVIAPELDDHLLKCVEGLRDHGATVFAPSSEFLVATSDKYQTSQLFTQHAVPHPTTFLLSEHTSTPSRIADSMGSHSTTIKRRDGAGCVGMQYFESLDDMNMWLRSDHSPSDLENWIVNLG